MFEGAYGSFLKLRKEQLSMVSVFVFQQPERNYMGLCKVSHYYRHHHHHDVNYNNNEIFF